MKWIKKYIGNMEVIVIVVLVISLIGMFFWWTKNENKKAADLQVIQQEIDKQRAEDLKIRKEQEATNSFYQKLTNGLDVKILIVGDSIGAGAGAETDAKKWYKQLEKYIRNTYNVSVSLTNVSMGGNSSYAGYARTMALNEGDYDLAVICYGQNDSIDGFSENYEALVRAIRTKYPESSIISILESSQREYTEKMEIIDTISKHYGIPLADTISPFTSDYDSFTNDGVHPNDAGQDIYFETVKNVIDEKVENNTGKMTEVSALNDVKNFVNFVWYGLGKDSNGEVGFERIDETTFILKTTASGILGIDYSYKPGDNKVDIYADNELHESITKKFNYDFSQRHIEIISENFTVKQQLKVVFSSKEQADDFNGMYFSWE